MKNVTPQYQGSCLCDAVTFEVFGEVSGVSYCHCSLCRKQTGLYYATVGTKTDQLSVEGEDFLQWYTDVNGAKRGFCKNCGSALFWKSSRENYSNYIEILAGSFDSQNLPAQKHHIYCANKGSFYDIGDSLPQYDQEASS